VIPVRILGVVALLAVGACAAGDDDSLADSSPTTMAESQSATLESPPTSDLSGSESGTESSVKPPATAPPSTVDSPTTTVPLDTGEPFGETWGLPDVAQLTPLVGGGPRPLFEWAPTEGADGYMLWVYTPDGSPYWSWMGSDTSTYLGGAVQLADDRPGPRVIDGMTWVIAAVDTDLEFLAVSERRWIGP
jgi:hypothetical protein